MAVIATVADLLSSDAAQTACVGDADNNCSRWQDFKTVMAAISSNNEVQHNDRPGRAACVLLPAFQLQQSEAD